MADIDFILYKPAVPGNIGACARAIKTMGFSQLKLIQPCDHLTDEARMMAHGSHDILESAEVFDSFEDAVSELDLLVCTTAKKRSAKHDYYSSREIRQILDEKNVTLDRIGVIFGTEESGLPNRIIQYADLAVYIPMFSGYPSLNLSQSVMIIAYELSMLKSGLQTEEKPRDASKTGYKELKQRIRMILNYIGIPDGSPLHHRILERIAILKPVDISLLHSITSRLDPFIPENNDSVSDPEHPS
jgi:tRNA/rRNA methyltransferase